MGNDECGVDMTRPERTSWIIGPLLALQFLTVLPVRLPVRSASRESGEESVQPNMAVALPWFPVVGAAIGVILVIVDRALAAVLSLGVRNALLLALPALLTGMLHLDGFVDCCDGLLGTRSVERRLEILRDSRVGAYGAIGVALLLITRFAALGALGGAARPLALVLAPTLGRWSIVYAVARYPYARLAGLGAFFRARASHLTGATLAVLVVVIAATVAIRPTISRSWIVFVVLLAIVALTTMLLWTAWASRRLGGGLTGDTYGALNELVELAVLVVAPVVMKYVLF